MFQPGDCVESKLGEDWFPGKIICIVKPVYEHLKRYVIMHDSDGFIDTIEKPERIRLLPKRLKVGKVIKVEIDGQSYEAVIK